jgi:glycosyltransferase involved in cell wall biosynthesis
MGINSIAPVRDAKSREKILASLGLKSQEYFLHVGTVEARKNVLLLVDAFSRLRKKLGDGIPRLVLVGAAGWNSEIVLRRLESTKFEAGRIIWLKHVGDGELAALYQGAKFTVIPGVLEGWGLPVRESLIQGVPCIVAQAGALPEAGGDFAAYFDPSDPDALMAAIELWISNEHAYAEAKSKVEERQATGWNFPTWDDSAKALMNAVATCSPIHELTPPLEANQEV